MQIPVDVIFRTIGKQVITEVTAALKTAGAAQDAMTSSTVRGASAFQFGGVAANALAIATGGILVAAFAKVTSEAAKYEAQIKKIEVLTGAQPAVVQEWSRELLKLSSETAQAPKDLADALYLVASAGQTGAGAIAIVEQSAKATAVGMGDTATIAKTLTAALNAYGSENLTAARAADILTVAVKVGGGEAQEYAGSLGRVLPIAAQLGVTFEEVTASVATFTRLGVNAAEAVTALRGTLGALEGTSKQGAKELEKYHLSYAALRQEIKEKGLAQTLIDLNKTFQGNEEGLRKVIPNIRALTGVLANAGSQSKQYVENLREIQNAHGSLDAAFAETTKTLAFQWKQLTNDITVASTELGLSLIPIAKDIVSGFRPIVDVIGEIARAFADLPPELRKILVASAAGAAVGGAPGAVGAGGLTAGFQFGSFLESAVGGVTLGIEDQTAAMLANEDAALRAMNRHADLARQWNESLTPLNAFNVGVELQGTTVAKTVAETMKADREDKILAEGRRLLKDQTITLAQAEEAVAAATKIHAAETRATVKETLTGVNAYTKFEDAILGAGSALGKNRTEIANLNQFLSKHGDITKLSTGALERLSKAAAQAVKDGAPLADELHRINNELINRQLVEAYFKEFVDGADATKRKLEEVNGILQSQMRKGFLAEDTFNVGNTPSAFSMALAESRQAVLNARDRLQEELKVNRALYDQGTISKEVYERTRRDLIGVNQSTSTWATILASVNDLMQILGISGDSALGRMVASIGIAVAGFESLNNAQREAAKARAAGDTQLATSIMNHQKLAGAITAVTGALAVYTQAQKARTNADVAAASVSGAATGAVAGAQLSGGNPYAIAIGAVVGLAIGFFTSNSAKKKWEAAGREVASALGQGISDKLREEIQKTADSLGISLANASLLHINDAIKETGRTATEFLPQVERLLWEVAHGAIPASQGIAEIGKAFASMRREAEAAGKLASAAMMKLISDSRAAGLSIPEVTAYVKEQLAAATEGLRKLIKVAPAVDEESARAQGAIFSAVFWASVRENGLIDSLLAMEDIWNEMIDAFAKAGIGEEIAGQIFGPIAGLFGLLGNEAAKGALEGISAIQEALIGLANSGYLTRDAFAGIQSELVRMHQQLLDNGATDQQALAAIIPTLAYIVSLHERYGFVIDDATQKLIDEAIAAGYAFPPDPALLMIDLLSAIVELLGGTLPESVQKFKDRFKEGMTDAAGGARTLKGAIGEVSTGLVDANNKAIALGGTLSRLKAIKSNEEFFNSIGPGGGPTELHAAGGAIVDPRPGGRSVTVGEGGKTEVVAPVAAFMNDLRKAIVEDIAAQRGGGEGTTAHVTVNMQFPMGQLVTVMEKAQLTFRYRNFTESLVDR